MIKASTQFIDGLILPIYKPVGLSPLQTLRQWQGASPDLAGIRLGYAGRLDPMAEGLMLALAGQANARQEELSRLDKGYSASFVLGLTTDSYDLLGIPALGSPDAGIELHQMEQAAAALHGHIDQPYPPYSAVQVKSKPLYWWTRHGRLDEIEIPSKNRLIKKIAIEDHRLVSATELQQRVEERVSLVRGDFRQADILTAWRNLLFSSNGRFIEADMAVACSSGTYIRGLVHALGGQLGCGAVATRICRTQIGEFHVSTAVRLESKSEIVCGQDCN